MEGGDVNAMLSALSNRQHNDGDILVVDLIDQTVAEPSPSDFIQILAAMNFGGWNKRAGKVAGKVTVPCNPPLVNLVPCNPIARDGTAAETELEAALIGFQRFPWR